MCEQAQSYKRKGADATLGHMTRSETDSTLHAGLLNESRRTRCGILSTLAVNGYLHHLIELGIAPTVRLHRLMVLSCAAELLGDGLNIFCGQAILGLVRQKTIQDRGQLRQGCELDIFRLHTVVVDDVLIAVARKANDGVPRNITHDHANHVIVAGDLHGIRSLFRAVAGQEVVAAIAVDMRLPCPCLGFDVNDTAQGATIRWSISARRGLP